MGVSVFWRQWRRAMPWFLLFGLSIAKAGTGLIVDNPGEFRGDAVKFSSDIFVANDHVPIQEFRSDPWPENYRSNARDNISIVNLRAVLGVSTENFSVDFVRRGDALLIATGDVAHAHYLAQTDQLFSGARALSIDYQFKGFEADGVRFGLQGFQRFSLLGGQTRWGVTASVLRGTRLRAEQARAQFSSDGNTASLNGQRELWSSDLVPSPDIGLSDFHPFKEESVPKQGAGYAIDFGFVHEYENGSRLSVAVNDAVGKIEWHNVPHMSQDFAINNLSSTGYSSNGTPLVSGYHDYRDYSMALAPKYQLALAVPMTNSLSATAKIAHIAGFSAPVGGIAWTCGERCGVSAEYDARWKTLGFSANYSFFSLAVSSDRKNFYDSRAFGFQFAVDFPI